SPAGNVSLKAMPVRARAVFGLLMLKVSEVFAPTRMLAAPNALVIDGGVATVKLAEAVFPVPPLVEVTFPVVLVNCPEAAPVTVTLNWHWLFAAIVAPESAIPVGAVVVKVPPQTVAEALATVSPVGSVSVKATPVSGSTFAAGLVIVNMSEVVAFRTMLLGLNTLAIDGGASTLTLAEAVPPVPPSVEVTLPVVLFCKPAAIPVTFIEKVQEPLAAIDPPDKLITFVPAVSVIVPPTPHEPVCPFGVEMINPAGSVSLKPTPVSAVVVLLFWMVKLKLVEPFSGIEAAPNALIITGEPTTVIEAFEVFPVPPSVEVTWTLLFFTPAVVPWILTETVQLALAANVPPERLMDPAPPTAVAVPPHVLLRFGVEATTNPAGRLSVKPIPVSARLVLRFWMVNVSEVVPFNGMLAAPKAFAIDGGEATVRLAEAVLPVPPLVEVTFPVVLVYCPEAAPVTVTLNWHWLFAAIVAPVNAIPVGDVVVSVPPQTVAEALATVSPVGRVSVKATPVSDCTFAAGFVI